MDPSLNNSLGGFGSGVATNDAGWSQSDVVINPVAKPKKRFSWKIVVAILSVVAVVAIVVFVVISVSSGQGASREEIYSKLRDFYYGASYQDLVRNYDSIVGKAPHLQSNNNTLAVAFPVRDVWIDGEFQRLESSRLAYNELTGLNLGNLSGDEHREFDSIIRNTKNVMDTIESNLVVVSDFYNAFIAPLDALYRDGTSVSCVQTEEISDLINNSITSDAAEIYFSVYCKVIEAYSKTDERDALQVEILKLVNEALGLLDGALKNIDDASEDGIEKLLSELSQ